MKKITPGHTNPGTETKGNTNPKPKENTPFAPKGPATFKGVDKATAKYPAQKERRVKSY